MYMTNANIMTAPDKAAHTYVTVGIFHHTMSTHTHTVMTNVAILPYHFEATTKFSFLRMMMPPMRKEHSLTATRMTSQSRKRFLIVSQTNAVNCISLSANGSRILPTSVIQLLRLAR